MNRVIATPPNSVEELCLVRLGLMVLWTTVAFFALRMSRAIGAASKQPEIGMLGSERWFAGLGQFVTFQYWASDNPLQTWSHQVPHSEWWQKVNVRTRTKGDFGVYHET